MNAREIARLAHTADPHASLTILAFAKRRNRTHLARELDGLLECRHVRRAVKPDVFVLDRVGQGGDSVSEPEYKCVIVSHRDGTAT